MPMAEPVLQVDELHVSYGPIRALRGISLRVAAGETVAIVGANGAGKTTLMGALSGILSIAAGGARFLGRDIAKTSPHRLARQGMLHVPEGRGTLQRMPVAENLRLAWEIRPCATPFDAAAQQVFARFPRLLARRDQLAGNLSGEQQMLAIARAVINPPTLLLLDEPSMGLSPLLRKEVFQIVQELRDAGMTILLVEQNVGSALRVAHRAYVLNQGVFVGEGSAAALMDDPAIMAGYLGHGKVRPGGPALP
jgi:branched-chain amino acid transport system ATP-binding protein